MYSGKKLRNDSEVQKRVERIYGMCKGKNRRETLGRMKRVLPYKVLTISRILKILEEDGRIVKEGIEAKVR